MNRIINLTFGLGLAVLAASCSQKVTSEAVAQETPAQQMLQRLEKVRQSGKVMFGHHDDTAYGMVWRYEPGRSDVKDVTGDYPALMNWDLGMIEWNAEKNLDGVPFAFMRNEIEAQDARGGMNSVSWHPRNPLSGGDSWDVTATPVAEMVKEGTAMNDSIKAWTGKVADFMLSLKDSEGNRIPVMFRPWHEHTGSWFWWGKDLCTADDYKALWHLTRKVFDERGVDNVVWVYSPDRITGYDDYVERYPGDEYVDILGNDVYQFNGEEGLADYLDRAHRQLDAAMKLSEQNGKMITLSETGLESVSMADWYEKALLPLMREYPILFACVWRNSPDKENHFYSPYPGHPAEDSFKAFYNDSTTLFLGDVAKIK